MIIAHRGASAFAPENTFAAFSRAIADGADGIEFDVRLAKNGVPVVFHDSTLDRIGLQQGLIDELSVSELQKIDIGSWFNQRNASLSDRSFTAERIPTLIDLLAYLKDYKGLIYVELKCRKGEIAPLVKAVCELIGKSNLLPQIIVKCFKLRAIALTKVLLPNAYTASLFAPKVLNMFRKKKHILTEAEDCLADEISLHYSLATKKLVSRAHRQGLPTTIWTADNPRWVRRATKLGINAVITNNPASLLAERDKAQKKD